MALKIPTRTERKFIENRGEWRDVEVEDRPYRVEHQFIERKGCHEDVQIPLTDLEIYEAGGWSAFFNEDGTRKAGAWPGDDEIPDNEFPTMAWTKAELVAFCEGHDIKIDPKDFKAVILSTIEAEFE